MSLLRLAVALFALTCSAGVSAADVPKDPLNSPVWADMARKMLAGGSIVFDDRVSTLAPTRPGNVLPVQVIHLPSPCTNSQYEEEMGKFVAQARRLSKHLFATSPFRERAKDFNVWALSVPTKESGVSRPSTGQFRASSLGARYDIFGSERYVLTLDNRALREIAQNSPYEFIEILVNNDTYGGGGIFGQFSTAAASNDWAIR